MPSDNILGVSLGCVQAKENSVEMAVDTSSWQSCHDSCQRLQRDIWALVSDRGNLSKTTVRYASLTEEIKVKNNQLTSGIDKLSGSELRNKGQTPTSGELTRRESLLSVLKSQQRQLNSLLSQAHISAAGKRDDENRKQLLSQDGGGVADLGTTGWGGSPTQGGAAAGYGSMGYPHSGSDGISGAMGGDPSAGMSQAQILKEQDRGLDSLHDIIVRQRAIAENIEAEVGVQNDIIDNLGDEMEQTNAHLLSTTQRVQTVGRGSSGLWKYWGTIVLLLVVIVILVAV